MSPNLPSQQNYGQFSGEPTLEELLRRVEALETNIHVLYGNFSGSVETASSIPVPLTGGPLLIIPKTAPFMMQTEIVIAQTQEAGLTAMEVYLFVNGIASNQIGRMVTNQQFAGGSIMSRILLNGVVKGDQISLGVASSGKIKCTFQSADLSLTEQP